MVLFSKNELLLRCRSGRCNHSLAWLTIGREEQLMQRCCCCFSHTQTTRFGPCSCLRLPCSLGLPTQACWGQGWVQAILMELLPSPLGSCSGDGCSIAEHFCYFSPELKCVEMLCWRTSPTYKRLLTTVDPEAASHTLQLIAATLSTLLCLSFP